MPVTGQDRQWRGLKAWSKLQPAPRHKKQREGILDIIGQNDNAVLSLFSCQFSSSPGSSAWKSLPSDGCWVFYLKWDSGLNSTFHITNSHRINPNWWNSGTQRGQWLNKLRDKTPLPFLNHPSSRSQMRYQRAEVYNAAVLFALRRAEFSLRLSFGFKMFVSIYAHIYRQTYISTNVLALESDSHSQEIYPRLEQ